MIATSRSVSGFHKDRRTSAAGFTTNPNYQLNDSQWFMISDLLQNREMIRAGGRPERDNRACFEAIVYVLLTGCPWKKLPKHFLSEPTCRRRFKAWTQQGLFQKAWQRLLEVKYELGQLDLDTLIADGTFSPANWLTFVCPCKPGGFGRRYQDWPTSFVN
jgi:transposase